MGWGGYGKGGYGWGFPPMMMMPWGKGKGKAGLHVIPNDSLVSLCSRLHAFNARKIHVLPFFCRVNCKGAKICDRL